MKIMNEIISASRMFAPEKYIDGSNNCYYCGSNCGDEYLAKKFVKATFTNRDIVKYPSSEYVCGSCVESLSYNVDIELIDGDKKPSSRVVLYSWILSKSQRIACTKKHREEIKNFVLNPPEPPFSIVIADSGKKQLIFRAPVSFDRSMYRLILDDDIINVDVEKLKDFITKAEKLCASIGKMKLSDPENIGVFVAFEKYYGDDFKILNDWLEIYKNPLSKLAIWLCKPQKECQNEYKRIECGSVQEKISRSGKPTKTNGSNGGESADRRSSDIGEQLALSLF